MLTIKLEKLAGVRLLLLCLMFFFVVVCFQSEAQKQLEEIKALREKMKEVADEARGKEDIYKQLVMRLTTSECWIIYLYAFYVPNGIKDYLY